jgi:hypothetical protein
MDGHFRAGRVLRRTREGRLERRRSSSEGQVGYLLVPVKFDVALRYAVIDPNRAVSRDVASTVTGAADYYFQRYNVKLQGEYSRTHRQLPSGGAANDRVFRLQVQLML